MKAKHNSLILIVEDDADTREALSELLRGNGYFVECAQNGLEALQLINSSEIPPALILLDLSMPIMDGREFLANLRQGEQNAVPIIVTTGELTGEMPGVTEILTKPLQPNRLFPLIGRLLH